MLKMSVKGICLLLLLVSVSGCLIAWDDGRPAGHGRDGGHHDNDRDHDDRR